MARTAFLDYLRIFAFVSVLVGHEWYPHIKAFVGDSSFHSTPRLVAGLILPWVEAGGAGVVVFFMVSGYIITSVLQREPPLSFLLKRIFRIYPLYVTALLLQAWLQWRQGSHLNFAVLLPQLLLIGDFFDTPYALGGVEWTLRIEIVFYVLMALFSWLNLFHARRNLLPFVLVSAVILLGILAPLPAHSGWSKSYISLYAPFLVLGAIIYLNEIRQVGLPWLGFTLILVLSQYYRLIGTYQPMWNHAHFATLAVLLFLACWSVRSLFASGSVVLLVSDLAFSVYLFHLWSWYPLKSFLVRHSLPLIPVDLQVLLALLVICASLCHGLEKPVIRFGRRLVSRLKLN